MSFISFIHISDVMLGSTPDPEYSWSQERAEEIYDTFENIIDYANDRRVDFLFISGNLFGRQPEKCELDRVNRAFSRLEETSVIYVAGRYDCMGEGSMLSEYRFCPGVYVMGRTYNEELLKDDVRYAVRDAGATMAVDHLYFPNKDIHFYGISYFARKMNSVCVDDITLDTDKGKTVLMFSGGAAGCMPVDFGSLKKMGFDYIALGGRQKYSVQIPGKAAYPGSPESVSAASAGAHGYIYGILGDSETSIEFVPAARRTYKTIDYPVTNYTKELDLRNDILRIIETEGRQNIYTVNIVRKDNCEKNFDISECLSGFRILNVNGESFDRNDYEKYQRANKNNQFGSLLDSMYSADLEHREGIKLVVDTMIDTSGIYMHSSYKMGADMFEKTRRQVITILSAQKDAYDKDPDMVSYEDTKRKYEISPDVLDELNRTWASERGVELKIKTLRNRLAELPRQNRRKKMRIVFRTVFVPAMLACIAAVLVLAAVTGGKAGYAVSGALGRTVFGLILITALLYYAGYGIYRHMTHIMHRSYEDEYATDSDILINDLQALENERDELHKKRVDLQTKNGYKESLHDSLSRQSVSLKEKMYYRNLLSVAVETLEKY